jgi:hypothetical protein
MALRSWIDETAEVASAAWAGLRSLWVDNVWPVLLSISIFFVLAAPLVVVILILWYLDSIGWRSSSGFYTIGSAAQVIGPELVARVAQHIQA